MKRKSRSRILGGNIAIVVIVSVLVLADASTFSDFCALAAMFCAGASHALWLEGRR